MAEKSIFKCGKKELLELKEILAKYYEFEKKIAEIAKKEAKQLQFNEERKQEIEQSIINKEAELRKDIGRPFDINISKYLARKDSENLLVVGCGNIAIYSIVAVLITMPNIKNVYICNPKNNQSLINKFEGIKETINNILEKCNRKTNVNFICSEDIESVVKISDIIVTATPSEKAMIKREWVKEGTHFSCMGACMEGKQEIDANVFRNAIIYADDEKQCIRFTGKFS